MNSLLSNRHPLTLTLALAALGSVPAVHAAPTTLNFDGALSTDITNAYSGLTFRSGDPTKGPVRTWAAAPATADTGANVLGLADTYLLVQTESTAIDILFDTAVSFVSIRAAFSIVNDFGFSISGLPFLAAYTSTSFTAATRLGIDTWNIAGDPCLTNNICQSGWDTLSWTSAAADIKGIRISGSSPFAGDSTRRALFDTLSYEAATGGGGGGTVPLPTSLLLAGLALGLLRLSSRGTGRGQPNAAAPLSATA